MTHIAAKVKAPEFPEGMEWLNTASPLSLRALRGKVVLLDFWTYCCINCMHVIPDLKRLEEKYPDELVVIGVHSAKFTSEKESENIREAILRYELAHPVVNDRDFAVWKSYKVRAWPSFALIDPQGKIVGTHSGEAVYALFDRYIGDLIRAFEGRGKLDRTPVDRVLEKQAETSSPFSFPGKLAVDTAGARLFVSDSNHNRIAVVDPAAARIVERIGAAAAGFRDGDCEEALFDKPQGIAVDGEMLYVADTGNHAIRRVDLATRRVETLAGSGAQARKSNIGGRGTQVELNSPWDLLVHQGALYIAMAGPHQLWVLDLETLEARPHAGSGREDRVDGPLAQAALAQPSGIATDGPRLFFADSEVSSVRAADIDPAGRVTTLVGEGLFDFGDQDGKGWAVRLQHPLGVLYHEAKLYVADTYNNKIKQLDPQTRRCDTLVGTGAAGRLDGPAAAATLNEPNGLALAAGRLYIADTNNHLIRMLDLEKGVVSTLQVEETRAST